MSKFVYLPHHQYPTTINTDNIEFIRDVGNATWIHFISGQIHKMHKDEDTYEDVLHKLNLSYLIED